MAAQNRTIIQMMNFMGSKYTSFTPVLDRYRDSRVWHQAKSVLSDQFSSPNVGRGRRPFPHSCVQFAGAAIRSVMRCGTISKRLVSEVIVGRASARSGSTYSSKPLDISAVEVAVHYRFPGAERGGVDQHSSPDSNVPAVQRMETARKARAKTGGPAETGGPAKSGNPAKVAK